MRGGWRGVALLAGLLAAAGPGQLAAQADFAALVERAQQAWSEQDPEAIVGSGSRVLLQLPGAEARSAVGREQAVRLLEGFLRRAEVLAVRVVSAREVESGQGYAELLRVYKVRGTTEARNQRVLMAWRRAGERGGWGLVELRVLDGGG